MGESILSELGALRTCRLALSICFYEKDTNGLILLAMPLLMIGVVCMDMLVAGSWLDHLLAWGALVLIITKVDHLRRCYKVACTLREIHLNGSTVETNLVGDYIISGDCLRDKKWMRHYCVVPSQSMRLYEGIKDDL